MSRIHHALDEEASTAALPGAASAQAKLADFLDQVSAQERSTLEPHRAGLMLIAEQSPYLWRLATGNSQRLVDLVQADPVRSLEDLLATTQARCEEAPDDAGLMEIMRRSKQEIALLVALADLSGRWDLLAVTAALTSFADVVVSCAVRHLLRAAARTGKMVPAGSEPDDRCGVVVLALGKHGAQELNYSSDVDLVVFFDPAFNSLAEDVEPKVFFVRLVRNLVRLLQERTADGYVLRVDLRLRPDPGSTAVAISLPAAFEYYERVGQNWERAALIKARPIAGDLALGERFIAGLVPFIWRKYFDYAAIADIHAMKRQIHAVRGHAEVTVAGHDVKLGRGGIREIEFFVQTQQLVFGGRRPQLRGPRTLDMLVELERDGWIGADARDELTAAYRFLRTVEHRLQMVADEQTQRLPIDTEALAGFARFSGFADLPAFEAELTAHLKRVEAHYSRLFENAPGLDTAVGSLVFTGAGDDPETLKTLEQLGFKSPELAAETIRGWHFGRRPAVQSPRAREVLTELVPALLDAFSGCGDADAALNAFDGALSRMPAAIELFSLLRSNRAVRELFADLLGAAPRLAKIITDRPHVLDAAIDPALMNAAPQEEAFIGRITTSLAQSRGMEAFLDRSRDIKYEEQFLIGVRLLADTIAPEDAAKAYSLLAEVLIGRTLARLEDAFAQEYGRVPDGCCILVALGKLGSREMSARSDLDLMLVYDFDLEQAASDGGTRSLHATQYYTRLTQRLVAALTAPTRRGSLYEVDMRLRPSGSRGPLATQLNSFIQYQNAEAETWEHMALTRARVIAGDAGLAARVAAEIGGILARPRERDALATAVREMRALIAQEKGEGDAFDLKIAPGGLIDIEFIAQFLLLLHARDDPRMLRVSPVDILGTARRGGRLDADDAAILLEAYRLLSSVAGLIATIVDGGFDPAVVPDGVKRRIAVVAGLPDFRALERDLAETRADVRRIFAKVFDHGSS